MARFSRQTNVRRTGSRANRSWASTASAAFTNIPAASKVLLSTFVLSNPGIDETVLRTVGSVSVKSDNPGSGEEQIGAFGMIVVTDIAAAAGIASIPGPVTNGSDDGWFTYVPFAFSLATFTSVGFEPGMSHRIEFDSKAKRMTGEGQVIALVVENIHASHAFDFITNLRMLAMVRGTR